MVNRIKENRQRLLSLNGRKCSRCGYCECDEALNFHHLDPKTKKFQLSGRALQDHGWHEILEESKKCILLCSNCHIYMHKSMNYLKKS